MCLPFQKCLTSGDFDELAVLLQFPSLLLLDGTSSYFSYLKFPYYRFYHVLGTYNKQNQENLPSVLKAKKAKKYNCSKKINT